MTDHKTNLPTIFQERDITWLSFNYRVLQEAKDPRVPLYERIKFLAIYSSNLDEFFRVRVASLRSFKELKKATRKALDVRPKKSLKVIHEIVDEQQKEFGRIFQEEIIPALAAEKIFLIKSEDFSEEELAFAKDYFETKIPHISQPAFLNTEEDFDLFLKDKGLYFIVDFEEADTPPALVEIPTSKHSRFITLPADNQSHNITFLDDIIRANLGIFFEDLTIKEVYSLKISRDAEMYIDDEYEGDLLEKIKHGIDSREIGLPTRFLYDSKMPVELVKQIKKLLKLKKNDLIPGGRYHNFHDFFGFPNPLNKAELQDVALPPLLHQELENAESIIAAMQEKDFMLHFPYQKYDYISKLIWEAADDVKVDAIKITLYRVAAKSDVANALLHARKMGKKVVVFIEAKARFDEKMNLFWGGKLEAAGAKVMYSFPGIKVHTKLMLIRRIEEGSRRLYTYLGTGNFNEKTAKLYADHALLTANKQLGSDAEQIFKLLEKKTILPNTKQLLISPFSSRKGFEKLINREIALAKAGKEAYMILKMNSLEDKGLMENLVAASQAGVKIQMIIRGMCCLIPGVPGYTDNIEIVSVIDRFLEHARVYIFGNNGEEKMYTASADWMTRNLDRRVEAVIPILDKEIYQELRHLINLQLQDNQKARWIHVDKENEYRTNAEEAVRSQEAIYKFLKNKGE
ncbi:MAG: polyphosphate kinase [Saprospiraceae bacterium]|jgi:polyphosphate kinase